MTKIGKKLAAVLLAVAMFITFVPIIGAQMAYAESGVPAMKLGADVLKGNVNTIDASTVWYANTTWRVIERNKRMETDAEGCKPQWF